ncbi:MAG: hypothetical protein RLZZ342_246 [Candidatus Parcubacteria bacterium]|jgi:hypothetical protein
MSEKIKPGGPNITGEGYNPAITQEPVSSSQEASREKPLFRADDAVVYALMTLMAGLAVSSLHKRSVPLTNEAPPVTREESISPPPLTSLSVAQLEEYKKAQSAIENYSGAFASGEARKLITMLDPNRPIAEVCRFTSDWMINQNDNLEVLWQYLKLKKSEWAATMEPKFEAARKIGGMFAPPTNEALRQKIEDRIKSKQPLKCGMGLLFVSTSTQHSAQDLGAEFITEVLKRLSEESRSTDQQKIAELAPVIEAAVKVIAAALPR